MAYQHKLKTGEGQCLNVAMLDALFGIVENAILEKTVENKDLARLGTRNALFAPYDVFTCTDGLYTVAVTTDSDFAVFCNAIGKPAMAEDARFATNDARLANYDAMMAQLRPWFADKTRAQADEVMTAANVAGGMVQDIPEVMHDEQLIARDMFLEIDDPGIGLHKNMANPVKMSKTPAALKNGSPLLGQDSDHILEELGYSADTIAAYREAHII